MCCDEEKMADSKKNDVSEDSRDSMWDKMMECCCTDMTDEEKQKWMKDMRKKMHHMRGHRGHMMGMMMGKMHGKGHTPWDMCRDMVSSMHQIHRVATLATPEVQGLFEDWIEQIEKELLDFLKDKETLDVKEIAEHFKISKDSAYYFLTRLAQKGKIKLNINREKN